MKGDSEALLVAVLLVEATLSCASASEARLAPLYSLPNCDTTNVCEASASAEPEIVMLPKRVEAEALVAT